jgi:hypothetical protein
MAEIDEPILQAAHRHSLDNRLLLASGGGCGCFHCLKTFDATEVTLWGGRGSATALCPYCHYDTVLSSRIDPIDPTFLAQMRARWFEGKGTPLDLSAEAPPKAAE